MPFESLHRGEKGIRFAKDASPRRRKLHIVRFRAGAKAHSFRCASSPQKTALGSPVRLQARSRRLAVATTLLRGLLLSLARSNRSQLGVQKPGTGDGNPFSRIGSRSRLTPPPSRPAPKKPGRENHPPDGFLIRPSIPIIFRCAGDGNPFAKDASRTCAPRCVLAPFDKSRGNSV